MDPTPWLARAADAPVARLATRSVRADLVDLVPVTFAILGTTFVTAIDHKPKTTRALARLDNIRAHPEITVLVDEWHDDWSQLWWVRLRGEAEVHDDVSSPVATAAIDALVAKYAPYREHRPAGPLIVCPVRDVRGWSAVP